MTTIVDDTAAWTEEAFAYIRDQLRAHATVGLDGLGKGFEVGDADLEAAASNPGSLPFVWITPGTWGKRRVDNFIVHRIRVDVVVLGACPPSESGGSADAQKAHREFASKVYAAALELRDAGYTARHWREWEPHEAEADPITLPLQNGSSLMIATHPFVLTRDRKWETD